MEIHIRILGYVLFICIMNVSKKKIKYYDSNFFVVEAKCIDYVRKITVKEGGWLGKYCGAYEYYISGERYVVEEQNSSLEIPKYMQMCKILVSNKDNEVIIPYLEKQFFVNFLRFTYFNLVINTIGIIVDAIMLYVYL